MKKVLIIAILGMGWCSCSSNKEKMLTETQIHAKADSLVGARVEELNRQSMEDLDQRRAIEVKAKADFIVQARTAAAATTKNKKK